MNLLRSKRDFITNLNHISIPKKYKIKYNDRYMSWLHQIFNNTLK